MAFGEKRVRAEVEGHRIEAVNTWFQGAAILVDGVEIARSDGMLAVAEAEPFVSAVFEGRGGEMRIDMHILSILFTQIELRVNGRHVAGDHLVKEGET